MADWRARLRPASFRGVPFFVEAAERDGGRLTHLHEFPGRKNPVVEDLGPAPRAHAVDAYLVGDDFMEARDRLLAALEEAGPGILVHPYFGTLEVTVSGSVRLRHSTREGRIVRLGILFVQTDSTLTVAEARNEPAEAEEAAAAQVVASSAAFEAAVDVDGVPDWTLESLTDEINRAVDEFRRFDFSFGALDKVAAFTDLVDALGSGLVELVRLGDFPTRVHDVFAALEDAVASKVDALDAYLTFGTFRGTGIGYLSETGKIADANAAAVEHLFREFAVAEAVRVAASIEWDSLEDALVAREKILAEINSLAETAEDVSYYALASLRAKLYAAVPPEDQALPRLATVTLQATSSTVLLSWRLFQNLAREEEIVTRNRPPWPGFLVPSSPLEVLVDPA